jgi:hypothetical protein
MRTLSAVVLHSLHQLALSLWLGGIVVLGAIGAPSIFGTAKRAGDTRWGMPLYTFAGEALGEAFRRFNYLVLVAGGVMLLAGLAAGFLEGRDRRPAFGRAALTVVAWGAAAWLTFSLYPQMLQARGAGDMALFDRLHRTYSTGFSLQMLLLLGVIVLTAWMHRAVDRTVSPWSHGDTERNVLRHRGTQKDTRRDTVGNA